MDFALLGPVEVRHRGRRIDIGGPKQRVILAHLLLQANHVVSTERLIDAVWGEEPPDTARNTLHAYVSRLRRALADAVRIESRAPGYTLLIDATRIDTDRFAVLLDQARALRATRPDAARELLTDALELWRGPALDDLSGEPSLEPAIARLEELRMSAIEERLETDLALGRLDAAIADLEALTREHPLRERLWALLMLSLYRAGRQADALAAFLRARRLLGDELGIEPSPELHQLQSRILSQDPALLGGLGTLRGYELRERLNQDGSATLFRAIQPRVGREVAIRQVDPALAQEPAFVRRFETDAQAVARLEHPHTVPLYDYWRGPDGAFLVHRFVRGGTLARALATGRAAELDLARLAAQLGSALAAAHRAGVAHGNVHPGNVLLDEGGDAYLTDFTIGLEATREADQAGLGRLLLDVWTAQRESGRSTAVDVEPVLTRASTGRPAPFANIGVFVEALSIALDRPAARPRPEPVAGNPFKGLRAFAESDQADFFGRDELVAELIARLGDHGPGHRFLAVVGGSGSGKSSVVRAGLLPALRRGMLPGAEAWFTTEMVPGDRPFRRLDEALVAVAVDPPATFIDVLTADPSGIVAAVGRSLPSDGSELLLVIDQFEELFTLTTDESERLRFLEALAQAVNDPHSRLRLVVTLRADFYDRPLGHRRIAELLGRRSVAVPPLSAEELAEAVVRPAEGAGALVEPELVGAMVADIVDRPGALPLLQYTLTELFDDRRDGRMTLSAYRDLGTVSGAVARRADRLYGELDDEGREAARQLFLRLVALGEGSEGTRRRVSLAELFDMNGGAGRRVSEAIDLFGRHRLLSFDRDPASREPTVEVAHEAILRAWDRLRHWIDDARADLKLHRQLIEAAADWQRSGRDATELWRGVRLEHAESLIAGDRVALTERERAFVVASAHARDAARSAEEQRRANELRLERRAVRRLRALAIVLAAGAFVAAVLTGVAVTERRRAEQAALETHARELAFASGNAIDDDPELAVLLALEAVGATANADGTVLREAEEALHRAVHASRIVRTLPSGGAASFSPDGRLLLTSDRSDGLIVSIADGAEVLRLAGHSGEIFNGVVSPDGTRAATNSFDGSTRVWALPDGREVWSFADEDYEPVGVAISPDGRLLATTNQPASGIHTVDLRDMTNGRLLHQWEAPAAVGLSFSPDGALLAAANATGITIWRIDQRTVELQIDTAPLSMTDVAFSPDGQRLVAGGLDKMGTVYDLDGVAQVHLFGHSAYVEGVAYSADGTRIATGAIDGTARVYDALSGQPLLTLAGHAAAVANVDFSADGSLLATGASDGTARIWDVSPEGGREWLAIANQPALIDVSMSTDGVWIGTAGQDGSAMLFDARGTEVARLQHDSVVRRIEFSPDGELAATASFDGTAGVWRVPSGDLFWTIRSEPTEQLDAPAIGQAIFSPDGTRLAVAEESGHVAIWDVVGRDPVARLHVADAPVTDIAWAPDGTRLAYGAYDGSTGVWDAVNGSAIGAYSGHVGPDAFHAVLQVAFSPAGDLVASVGFDGTASIWDASTGEERRRLVGPTGEVWAVDFSPDGSVLATGGGDAMVRLWSVASGRELLALGGHRSTVTAVEFTEDGKKLITASESEVVGVYALALDDLVMLAHQRVTRSLTGEECRQYLGEACAEH